MARFELKLPKMGESVAEAIVTNWIKKVGDTIAVDDVVLEVATDKVDSELPSDVAGVLIEQFFNVDEVVKVGQTIAIIETSDEGAVNPSNIVEEVPVFVQEVEKTIALAQEAVMIPQDFKTSEKFFSPLVRNIAKEEGLSIVELESIIGSGKDGRLTKEDLLEYIIVRKSKPAKAVELPIAQTEMLVVKKFAQKVPQSVNGGDEIIEMDRMRKLIAGYMVASLQTSAHVQSFIEVDVTNIVKWRDKVKSSFENREGERLTFTPIFMEAVARALKDYPMMNISIDGDKIIKKKNINLGMAAALSNGNLIVPVIKNADQLNLVGMASAVNDLGSRAKEGKLKPEEVQDGTYTVTNIGAFGSVFGTPIISQPQVGILAIGAIRKVPAVIETPDGDFVGIRQKMFLSHSYDHRVIDGALGGNFVKRVAEYLETFDINRDF